MTDKNIQINKQRKNKLLDNKHILSCLTFLEKFYEKSQDKYHQERLFRINKAINSIKKYSNCKVSSFKFKPKKPSLNELCPDINNNQSLPLVESVKEENSVEDIILLIEKELKDNGINEKDINNSLLSTSKKSLNSSDNMEISEKNDASLRNLSSTTQIAPKVNLTQKRLSKLFLKIELKLKTFLQEHNMKNELNSDEKENNNGSKEKDEENNKLFSFEGKLTKSPSKLPNVIDSFFSDKKKVNSILSNVKKQRRKSVMEYNTKYSHLSKEEKENEYINDSGDKEQYGIKRKKIKPCSAQVVIRQKVTKNHTTEKISNFYDMIDEKEEEKEDLEDINAFDKIIKEDNTNNNNNHNNIVMNDNLNVLNIKKDPSIQIASSLNNKKKLYFNVEINNSNNNKEKINSDSCEIDNNNYYYVSKNSVFNDDNEKEKEKEDVYDNSMKNDKYGNSLLDDEILMQSSNKKEKSSSKDYAEEEESKGSGDSSKSVNSKDNSSNDNDNDKYNMLKYINDSKNRKDTLENEDEDKNEKKNSNCDENDQDERKLKNNFQREIVRANNINSFYNNSIFSPLRDINVEGKIIGLNNCAIEEFTKINS